MKNKIGIVKDNVKINKKIFIFLTLLFIIGILFGSFFIVMLDSNDKNLVIDYITDFIAKINYGKIDYLGNYLNLNIETTIFIISIWLLGISVVGAPIMLFIYFSKAFTLGFSIGAFILKYNIKGILLAFIYTIPHALVLTFLYIILLNYAITLSIKLITSFIKRKSIDFKVIMQKYSLILLVVFIGTIIINAYEIFIVPKIFDIVLNLLNIK